MQAIPMTLRGAEKLREELDFLKSVRRPEIIAAIAEAREHGDLKENAEYHAAREQQGFCEGRIKDIEAKLSNAQVIDITKMPNNGRVIFGSTVTVLNLDNDEEQTYRIVGDDEADFKQNLISVNSPIARGLIGKEQDDVVTIRTPGGEVEYEIIKVEYLISLTWQRDFTLFRWAVEHQRFTDDLYITGAGFAHDGFHDQVFSVSVFRGDFHLDQLVVFQRLFNLGKHPFGQTIVAKHHYRLERMCQTFKVLFLFSTQIHRIFLLTLGLKTVHSTAISLISPNSCVEIYVTGK
ncbi:hypothetical protein Lal_00009036 [Lupinus albus]|nr:hypothetical protein Lal_00009036 [Lupinus albus]